LRAIKVFEPRLFAGRLGEAERRRLALQRSLIGHNCPYLIQTHRVEEAEDTAFVEMDLVDWPQLGQRLGDIPDASVPVLISQLVAAVKFLEDRDIVHRDIKPENIHVNDEFTKLLLLDLGVSREFVVGGEEEAAETDSEHSKPFLATAQYSSPEYLFRLDQPTEKLWRGLNLYQVGAVLHDLIMREPLYKAEVSLGNRWLVARAVLQQTPSLDDEQPTRHARLKAVAARCLTKDLETRLQTVHWTDFEDQAVLDQLGVLHSSLARLSKRATSAGPKSMTAVEISRTNFVDAVCERTRGSIISSVGPQLPSRRERDSGLGRSRGFSLCFTYAPCEIRVDVCFDWFGEIQCDRARVKIAAYVVSTTDRSNHDGTFKTLCEISLPDGEDHLVYELTQATAKVLTSALEQFEVADNMEGLIHRDLLRSDE